MTDQHGPPDPPALAGLRARLAAVRGRIDDAARACGRDPAAVRLVLVTKTHPAATVALAAAAGVTDVGENRVQELAAKRAELAADPAATALRWHLIGTLQRNKARQVAPLVELVHSLDSVRLAAALDRAAATTRDTPLPVLLQVNVTGESAKGGVTGPSGTPLDPADPAAVDVLVAAATEIADLPHLRPCGLMTVAPLDADPDGAIRRARAAFRDLATLRQLLRDRVPGPGWDELSMGMTGDFEEAIGQGATIVRVGRAVLGARPQRPSDIPTRR
jgi:hypothetical protein